MTQAVRKYHPFVLSLLALQISVAHGGSLPEDGQISLGAGSISQSDNRLTVQQNSDKLSVNWQSFNIGAGKSVIFEQPSSSAIALNRVLGSSRSEIYGSLQANGRVFLINPNGVLFGPTAEVNVGGLVATTKQLADGDFAADRFQFTHNGQLGEVVNQGHLQAVDGGFIVLAADTVKNQGTITATKGHAVLAAGETINLNLDTSGNLQVAVNRDQLQALIDQQGLIAADSGQVILTAQGQQMLQTSAINLEGIVRAQSIQEHNGQITIDGGDGAVMASNLELDASGLNAGERGGEITITGRDISLKGSTKIDAQGHSGGGNVRIGGDFQGQGDLPRAETLNVSEDTRINASATETGDGGTVVLWSDQKTDFYGGIKSRGGAQVGDGGTVEVSGKEQLNYQATEATDTRAPNGSWGTLWLDPANINITDGTGGNNSGTANSSGGNITDGQLVTELGSTGVNLIADTITDDGAGVNVTTGSGGALTLTATTGAGTINLGGNYSVNGGLVLNHTGSSTISGVIGGAGSLTKNGSGTTILTGNSTYTGTTAVNAGTLQIGTGGSTGRIGSGAVAIASDGTLRHFRAGVFPSQPTFANNVSGSGHFILSGGSADFTGNWTSFAGTATIDSGARYRAGNNNATSSAAHWVVNGIMSLDSTNGVTLTLGSLSGSGFIAAGGSFTSMPVIVGGRNEDSTFSGSLSNSSKGVTALTKVGTGTLTLTSTNAAHGAPNITISAGTLAIGDAGSLTSSGQSAGTYTSSINIANGATFEYGSSADQTISGTITGAGQLVKDTTSTLTLTGNNTNTGNTLINNGILQVGNGGTSGLLGSSTINIAADGTLLYNRSDTFPSQPTLTNTLLGDGLFHFASGWADISGDWTSFAGDVTIDAGARYRLASNSASSSNARWTVNGDISQDTIDGLTLQMGSLSGSGDIYPGGGSTAIPVIVGALNEDSTFSGTISGSATTLTKIGSGKLTLTGLTGAGYYTGATTVNEGILTFVNPGTLLTSSVSIDSGAILEINANTGGGILGSGSISGAGIFRKTGAATWSMTRNGANTVFSLDTGALIDVQEGSLRFDYGFQSTWTNNKSDIHVASGATFDIWDADPIIDKLTGSGTVTSGEGLLNPGHYTLTLGANNGSATFAGILRNNITGSSSRSLSLLKSGTGTQILTGNNTYSGTTTISDGTLQVGNGGTTGTLGSGAVANNGTLVFDRSDTVSLSTLASNAAGITGTGDLTARIGGGFTVDRAINLTGTNSEIILGAGINNLAGDGTGGDLILSNLVTTTAGGTITLFSGNPDTATLVAQLNGATGTTQYKTYNAGFSDLSGAVTGTRNIYYRVNPTLTVSLSGVDKAYDGLVTANPTAANYRFGTGVDGDNDAFSLNTSHSGYGAFYDSANGGIRSVTVNNLSLATTDTTNGNFVVQGYQPAVLGSGTIIQGNPQTAYSALIDVLLLTTGVTPPTDASLVAVSQVTSGTPPSQETGNTSAQSEGDQGRVSVAESPASNLLADTAQGVEPSIACGPGIALPAGIAAQPVASCQK